MRFTVIAVEVSSILHSVYLRMDCAALGAYELTVIFFIDYEIESLFF